MVDQLIQSFRGEINPIKFFGTRLSAELAALCHQDQRTAPSYRRKRYSIFRICETHILAAPHWSHPRMYNCFRIEFIVLPYGLVDLLRYLNAKQWSSYWLTGIWRSIIEFGQSLTRIFVYRSPWIWDSPTVNRCAGATFINTRLGRAATNMWLRCRSDVDRYAEASLWRFDK